MIIPVALAATACATTQSYDDAAADMSEPKKEEPAYKIVQNPAFAAISQAADPAEMDRRAILAMQGDYKVDFNFEETVMLAPEYERHDDKTTGAFETVFVVEDSADRIVLQHILVMKGGHVIKHWRQDWHFEPTERFEFVADQSWQVVPVDSHDVSGAWTQCVFEVSDAPRYCGTGRWSHNEGVSTWTSDASWRPLPRREYTKRSDYNALRAINRHTVTSHGWTHEQDNTKVLRDGRDVNQTLVREFGFNDYRSIEGYDFEPASVYWNRTSDYWARVRSAWSNRMALGNTLKLKTEVDGMPVIVATFEHAEKLDEMTAQQQADAIDTLLNEWTEIEAQRKAGL
ncbi:MAG: DUF6607 family protein [Pseudomonadota bacterium]